MTSRPFVLTILTAMLVASSAHAQQLAPAPVDLTYRFHPGQKLHYHRVFETRNAEKPDGFENDNYDYMEDYYVTVDRVEPNGGATLTVRIQDSYDWHGAEDGSKKSMGGRASDIPLFSVTLDRRGNYMNGTILRRTPHDSEMVEKMKDPKFQGWKRPDSSSIKFTIGNLFAPRPEMKSTLPGDRGHDSTFQTSQMQGHHLGGPTPSGTKAPPAPPSGYNALVHDYSIVQGTEEHTNSEFRLITNSTKYDLFGKALFVIHSDEDQHIRTTDGILKQRTYISYSTKDGVPEQTKFKNTITLVSEE